MKRSAIRVLAGVFAISALTAIGPAARTTAQPTHKPLLEFATATTCPYCARAHQALRELDVERKDTFHYVSLVCDKNATAYARARNEYNVYGFPTVYFDGGYVVCVGAGSAAAAKATYLSNLPQCEYRRVPNLDLALQVEWMGPAKMYLSATLKNNSSTAYAGHVRIYVTEIQSSLGWRDTNAFLYTYAFLGYAVNQPVSVGIGQKQDLSTVWDGGLQGFPSLTHSNVKVIAAVFNGTGWPGYSVPPNQYPFTAYYVDQTAAARPGALGADTRTVSQLGGAVKLGLYAGSQNGYRGYVIGGSLSGTTPGMPMPGNRVTLPLNFDLFTTLVVQNANTPMFSRFLGNLDWQGQATATLNVPAVPGTQGLKLYFAFVLYDRFDFVSNPVVVEIR
ncbi:MAG: glutaredoxin [Planctomycetes bacterium]|nr:glutaredoxin [Planctomycetota bacterium]